MKTKFNLVCDTFTHHTGNHTGYSVHGKISKYIEWCFNNYSSPTFYVDDKIDNAFNDSCEEKYAWLLESKYMIPNIVNKIKENPRKYLEHFKYIFTHDEELLSLDSKFKWVPAQGVWIQNPAVYNKSKLVSFITSNKNITAGHKLRLQWLEYFKDKVDVFGRGFNEIEFKEIGLCDYMFSIVIESGLYDTYFTEKILDCFASGTIPIYLGTDKIKNYFNEDGIISLTKNLTLSEELYYSKITAVNDNFNKVQQYEILEDFIYLNYFNKNNEQ
jgi:hypothetical protein